ncbi:DUF3006 family protein [Haloarcula marina]|uniref:DUF3006 family protein n=1 Tax=Haloarcula marina TaxID=2961574 RepID=UPI0020B8B9CA|nr:DUF3006 family protein [Halomicroarcula marina]
MIPDGVYTVVVDRIEESLATLEVTDEDSDDRYSLVLDETELPEDGRHADAILTVELEDEEIIDAVYRKAETAERKESAQRRFDRLAKRLPRDDEE